METEVSKLQKSLDSSRASYQNIQKQYQEQCSKYLSIHHGLPGDTHDQIAEAEKYRNILRRKDEEFKDNEDEANLHLTEVKKVSKTIFGQESVLTPSDDKQYKQDRESAEAVFLALQADLVAANQIEDEFREQRRQNDVLKETIDRLRFDLDELRITAAAQAAQATQAAANAASTASAKAASSLARELSFKLEAAEAEGDDDESDEGSEEGDGERTEADDDEYMETIITTSRRRVSSTALLSSPWLISSVEGWWTC